MELKNKVRKKLDRCKKKALETYRGDFGVKVNWSEGSKNMFGEMFDLFFEQLVHEFYIRSDGRKPESDLEVKDVE